MYCPSIVSYAPDGRFDYFLLQAGTSVVAAAQFVAKGAHNVYRTCNYALNY